MKRILLVIVCCAANLLMGAEVSRKTADSRRNGAELAETLFKRKDAKTITGDELVAEIKSLANERLPNEFWTAVQTRLAGRELTFTNFDIDKDCTFRGNDEGYLLQVADWKNPFSLMTFFPTSYVDRVSWIQEKDRVARLTGTVLPNEDNFAYYALRLRGTDIEMSFPKPPPIEKMFDLKTVTGDELMEKRAFIRHSQCHDLARALEGRELTFHNLSFSWFGSETTASFVALEDGLGLDATFRLDVEFSDPQLAKKVQKLRRFSPKDFFIRELKGIVASENDHRRGFAGALRLKGTHVEPNEPLEEIPPFDAATITGDGVIQLLKSFKKGYEPHLPEIIDKLIGRTLTFTNVHFSSLSDVTETNAVVKGFAPMGLDSWIGETVAVFARVNAEKLDALPWDLSWRDTFLRLSGRVVKEEPKRMGCMRVINGGIHLADATFEVAWQNEKLPPFDAKTLTGDEFAKMSAGFDKRYRRPMMQRMLKAMEGRRLTFSRCDVLENPMRPGDARKYLEARFDIAPAIDGLPEKCSFPAAFVGEEQLQMLQDLSVGTQLTNVSGTVVRTAPRILPSWHGEWCLTNLSYQTVAPQEALPDFDAATITGDELVRLLDGMKRNLTPRQIGVLRNRLAGRRLTFTRMQGVDCVVGREDSSPNRVSVIQMNRSATWSKTHKARCGILLRTPDTEYRKVLNKRRLDKCDDLRVSATVSTDMEAEDRSLNNCVLILADGVIERMDDESASEQQP